MRGGFVLVLRCRFIAIIIGSISGFTMGTTVPHNFLEDMAGINILIKQGRRERMEEEWSGETKIEDYGAGWKCRLDRREREGGIKEEEKKEGFWGVEEKKV